MSGTETYFTESRNKKGLKYIIKIRKNLIENEDYLKPLIIKFKPQVYRHVLDLMNLKKIYEKDYLILSLSPLVVTLPW